MQKISSIQEAQIIIRRKYSQMFLVDEKQKCPLPDGLKTTVGHTGNGHAKITKIS